VLHVPKFRVELTSADDARLIANGYEPVVVLGKAPVALGWQTGTVTIGRISNERAEHPEAKSTGLRTGTLIGIDIDVHDAEHVAQFAKLAESLLGNTDFARKGKKGVMLGYRTDTPTRKITVAASGAKIEILGVGQQFVAYGLHPETQQPYRWIGGDDLESVEPLTCPVGSLPLVTPDRLYEYAYACAKRLEQLGYGSAKTSKSGQALANRCESTGKRVSWARLRERLSWIHPMFDGTRPACYPPVSSKNEGLPYDGDAWTSIALCLRDANIPLLDDGEHDWIELIEQWSNGSLWFERTKELLFIHTYPDEGVAARLAGHTRESGAVSTIATINRYAADAGCPLPSDDEPQPSASDVFSETVQNLEVADTSDSGTKPSGPISFFDLLTRTVSPVRELIPGLIERGTVTFLSATGGSHKSRLALQWGLCISAGSPVFGRAVQTGDVPVDVEIGGQALLTLSL
jgi:hypothetical protein